MIHKKRIDFLPNISIKTIENLYRIEVNAKSKIRLQCAILRKEGKTLEEISDVTKKSKSTIGDILMRFDKKGLAAKDAIKQRGQPKKLSDSQSKKVKKMLEKKPVDKGFPFVVWTTKLVGYAIKKMFGVIYSLRQIRNLLKNLMFSLQKQRPEHLRANKEIQRQFKKNFDEELENLILTDMRSSFWMKAHSNLSHTS
ncbi:MAG: winged helix-turn-helix domain-containing protein, partial [Nanoarchaeota archaeon]